MLALLCSLSVYTLGCLYDVSLCTLHLVFYYWSLLSLIWCCLVYVCCLHLLSVCCLNVLCQFCVCVTDFSYVFLSAMCLLTVCLLPVWSLSVLLDLCICPLGLITFCYLLSAIGCLSSFLSTFRRLSVCYMMYACVLTVCSLRYISLLSASCMYICCPFYLFRVLTCSISVWSMSTCSICYMLSAHIISSNQLNIL